MYFCAQFIKI